MIEEGFDIPSSGRYTVEQILMTKCRPKKETICDFIKRSISSLFHNITKIRLDFK